MAGHVPLPAFASSREPSSSTTLSAFASSRATSGSLLSRRDVLRFGVAVTATAVLPHTLSAAQPVLEPTALVRPPNFIVIFTDDQGYGDLGCFGAKDLDTPNLDRMAAEGMRFTEFYSAAPVCTPSRAALLTGRYPLRVGMPQVIGPGDNIGLDPRETTLAEILKQHGYGTMCVGKWHLGHQAPFLPTNHGFDHFLGIPYSNDMPTEAPDGRAGVPLMRDEQVLDHPVEQDTLTRRYTQEAVRFIRESKDKPFFLYLPHTKPHVPLHVSPGFAGKSKRGLYGDVIAELDWSVGEILKVLRESGIDEHTCVVFTSDNGPWLGKKEHGGSARPLRLGKFSTCEGGMRVPCIMRWPGRIPAGSTCEEVASTMDLLPTFSGLAKIKLPADHAIDGQDIAPLLLGQPGATTPHEVFYYFNRHTLEAARSGKWKYHRARPADERRKEPRTATLYDLKADIGETTDLLAVHPEIGRRLEDLCVRFDADLNAEVARRRATDGGN